MMWRLMGGLSTAALLLVACGSTAVQQGAGLPGAGQTPAEGLVDELDGASGMQGVKAPEAGDVEQQVAASSEEQTRTSPRRGDPAVASLPEPGRGSGTPRTRGRAPTASALQGVTDDAITVGFAFDDDRNQSSAAVGAETNFPDQSDVIEIMVDWVNTNGGLGGRELKPFYRPFTSGEYRGPGFSEALCRSFTEDNDIYAAVTTTTEQLVYCMAKGGVPVLSGQPVGALDAQGLDRVRGFLYHSSALDLTQNAVLTAQAHMRMQHVTPASTVGVITIDEPSYRRAADAFEAQLDRNGIAVADTVAVTYPGQDLGAAQLSNAVLRFRQRGVDRVVVFESNGLMWWQFTVAAESQAYRPKYMLNPVSFAEGYVRAGLISPEQVAGSKGVGLHTILHVNRRSEPYAPRGRAICRKILDAGGMSAGPEDGEAMQLAWCEPIRLLKTALDRATDLSPQGLQAAVESLGRSFKPAQAFGAYHGPGHHAGAGTYFTYEYVADCHCFRINSDPRKIPGTP